jgi:hypothetical protein
MLQFLHLPKQSTALFVQIPKGLKIHVDSAVFEHLSNPVQVFPDEFDVKHRFHPCRS